MGDVLVFFDMPVDVRVVRRLSTFSFGWKSGGSWCDRAAVGRAQRRAGLEVFNSERNEPCPSQGSLQPVRDDSCC